DECAHRGGTGRLRDGYLWSLRGDRLRLDGIGKYNCCTKVVFDRNIIDTGRKAVEYRFGAERLPVEAVIQGVPGRCSTGNAPGGDGAGRLSDVECQRRYAGGDHHRNMRPVGPDRSPEYPRIVCSGLGNDN